VNGNPLTYTDPSGRNAWIVGGGAIVICALVPSCREKVTEFIGDLISAFQPPVVDVACEGTFVIAAIEEKSPGIVASTVTSLDKIANDPACKEFSLGCASLTPEQRKILKIDK
jgi:hypothetical protein